MTSPFRITRRVEFRDTDAAGIVHFSVFFTYMEAAEHALWRELGFSVKQPDGDGAISFPRVAAECQYASPVRFEDDVDIAVRVERLGEKSVTFAFDITCDGRDVAAGKLTAVCCRFVQNAPPKSMPIPAEVREKLEPLIAES